MASAPTPEATDGPVLSMINKRLRALRKKYNRILQMEESISQGKRINREQEDVLHSKPSVCAAIDELEKLRLSLPSALFQEIGLALRRQQPLSSPSVVPENNSSESHKNNDVGSASNSTVVDLLNLLYFGSLFNVKPRVDFTATMLSRTHERGCCLTYDTVTDDATDLLGERDLDMISLLSELLISRPPHSSLSHKNALQKCIEHAQLWSANSDKSIDATFGVSYAGLRERLNKIMASDYFTITPAMNSSAEVAAAAAGNFATVPSVPFLLPDQVEGYCVQYHDEVEEAANFQEYETGDNLSSPSEELQKDHAEAENAEENLRDQQEQAKPLVEVEHYQREGEAKEQYTSRRNYQNQRGVRGGGRRGYSNGRVGRSGGYQNGRSQYYDQPGNFYPRNYYNNQGRGNRGGANSQNNHGSGVQGVQASADAGVAS